MGHAFWVLHEYSAKIIPFYQSELQYYFSCNVFKAFQVTIQND